MALKLDGYIRVSRIGGRAGEGYISPGVQREGIKRYASELDGEVVAWQDDQDYSGGNTDRPGFQTILDRLEAGLTDGITPSESRWVSITVSRPGDRAYGGVVPEPDLLDSASWTSPPGGAVWLPWLEKSPLAGGLPPLPGTVDPGSADPSAFGPPSFVPLSASGSADPSAFGPPSFVPPSAPRSRCRRSSVRGTCRRSLPSWSPRLSRSCRSGWPSRRPSHNPRRTG